MFYHWIGHLIIFRVLSLVFLGFLTSSLPAQTLPVSDRSMQEYWRLKQLSGNLDSVISFHILPFSSTALTESQDSSAFRTLPENLLKFSENFQFSLLPLNLVQQFNSHHPYGWNDGAMIPAKSYQSNFSAGFFTKLGPLSIQLQPEFIFAGNPPYLEGNDLAAANKYQDYLSFGYSADIPAYYKIRNFTYLGFGQSSIRLNFGPASIGISNENLWWGPGRKNSLLMSNSARGFKHLTLNTLYPVSTPLGSIEGQLISGRLENSDFPYNNLGNPEWRYLSGLVFNYQPRWVPGLFIGLSRVFQMYHSDVSGIDDYFPLFQPFEKLKTNEGSKNRDQITSVFGRLLIEKAQSEIYFEYGRNDHSVDIRDFNMEPDHSRAYIVGFQKLVDLAPISEKLLISAEIAQLSQSPVRFVREAGSWYVHSISQGYTHRGEVLGAGIGPGGNTQTFDVSWLKGLKKLGIQFERYVDNNDYYQIISRGNSGQNGQWVDLSAGVLFNWDYKNLLINGKIQGIQSLNYLWQSGFHGTVHKNVFNVHANVGLSYYLK